jgi:hypothetical protein
LASGVEAPNNAAEASAKGAPGNATADRFIRFISTMKEIGGRGNKPETLLTAAALANSVFLDEHDSNVRWRAPPVESLREDTRFAADFHV